MKRKGTRNLWLRIGAALALVALVGLGFGLAYYLRAKHATQPSSKLQGSLTNNQALQNPSGEAATFSTRGAVNLTGEFFKVQGKNGQSCATCHIPEEAWSITPATLQRLFNETDGKHPVFSALDVNNPKMDVSTGDARWAAYSMMLTRAVFRRGGPPKQDAEWELIAVDDPHGLANLNLLVEWRRSMPTINFPLGSATVNWDGANTAGEDLHAGLVNQTGRLITGALQGQPATPAVINEIVDFESSLFSAQVSLPEVGRLDADGARGGPEALSQMKKEEGGFNLFDAWKDSDNPKRAQIYRGQEVFNSVNPSHKSCIVCHNSVNNGTNTDNSLFDINTSSARVRTPDLPLYTFRNKRTGETIQLTDAGQGNITGRWDDLGLFKAPTLRGLAARAPYFHNGIAMTLEDVVRHYENNFGFIFTDEERRDLVAFLKAL
jgi:cytochrome c peroxidase